jgi:hypothetical protein
MAKLIEFLLVLSPRQKLILGSAWLLSVLVAFGIGWGIGRPEVEKPTVIAEALPEPQPEVEEGEPVPPEIPAMPVPAPQPESPPVKPPVRREPPKPQPEPVAEEPVVEKASPAEPATPLPGVLERAREIDRVLEEGGVEAARREASELLKECGTYDGLKTALAEDGAGELQARLSALRILQAAGYDEIGRDLAREIRRAYAGTDEVAETIRRYAILRPRITSTQSSISKGRHVTVSGELENPDIVSVRRIRVAVEALDGAGNRLGTVTTRTRPRRLEAGEVGSFTADFKGIDPSLIVRTRASVLEYEYEVLGEE